MILGDATIEPDEFDLFEGTNVGASGKTDSFLLYAGAATTRGLALESVPYRDPRTPVEPKNLTPYERFILDMVDGQHTVEELRVSAGLDKQEMMTTMLTLADKSLIAFAPEDSSQSPQQQKSSPVRIDRTQSVLTPVEKQAPDSSNRISDTSAHEIPNVKARTRERVDAVGIHSRQRTEKNDELDFVDAKALLTSTSRNLVIDDDRSIPEQAATVVNHIERSTTPIPSNEHLAYEAPMMELESEPSSSSRSAIPLAPSQKNSIPAAITELGDAYVSNLVDNSNQSSTYDFGEDESEKSLSLGLSEEDEAFSELELAGNLPLSSTAQRKQRPDSVEQMNDAVSFALDELADELSLVDDGSDAHDLFSDDEELELSDDFSALERRLKNIRNPAPRKPSIKLKPIEEPEPEPMRLDSQFIKVISEPPKQMASPKVRRRGVIKEVDRRNQTARKRETKASGRQEGVTAGQPDRNRVRTTGVGQAKAEKLFAEALADKAAKNFVSAKMNIKLALTFDPDNPLYKETLESLSASTDDVPQRSSKAMELYQKATTAEKNGRIDEAVELLREALRHAKDAPIYNRLGVLLAMRKLQYAEARELIETAIRKDSTNGTYQHNLKKVLAMQATMEVDRRAEEAKQKKGLLGFLSRRKKK